MINAIIQRFCNGVSAAWKMAGIIGDAFEYMQTKAICSGNAEIFLSFMWDFYVKQEGGRRYAGSKNYKEHLPPHRVLEWETNGGQISAYPQKEQLEPWLPAPAGGDAGDAHARRGSLSLPEAWRRGRRMGRRSVGVPACAALSWAAPVCEGAT